MKFAKFLVIVSLNWFSMSSGFVFGQVACLVGALQNQEEGIHFSEGQISLIASSLSLMCMIGFALAGIITDKLGRRWPFAILSVPSLVYWIMLYYSTYMYQFMISRLLGGISSGGLVALNIYVTAEYVSPNTRAFFLNMVITAASAIGTILAHAVGITLNWRTVALIGTLPAVTGIFLPYFWVESPHWLASKGRFEESVIAFRKLHGSTQDTERELNLLINVERSKRELYKDRKTIMKRLSIILKQKCFWEPIILSLFMNAYLAASGKYIFCVLATVIIEQITGKSDVLLFTLLVDGFLLIGGCMSCFLIRKTSLRTLLFITGFAANIILIIFSIFYYFRNGQSYFDWINITLLSLYFIIINTGPFPLIEALYSEIFPMELKAYMFAFTVSILMIALSLSIFLLPYIVTAIGYHGLFLINAGIMSISLGCIWLKLPETKGKTLQEIEVYFKTKSFAVEEVLNNEQAKNLLL